MQEPLMAKWPDHAGLQSIPPNYSRLAICKTLVPLVPCLPCCAHAYNLMIVYLPQHGRTERTSELDQMQLCCRPQHCTSLTSNLGAVAMQEAEIPTSAVSGTELHNRPPMPTSHDLPYHSRMSCSADMTPTVPLTCMQTTLICSSRSGICIHLSSEYLHT